MATERPMIIGPEAGPEEPYPRLMEGKVISGFGRGSKELGIPTANLPVDDTVTPWISDAKSGVYFGWASIALPPSTAAAAGAPTDTEAAPASTPFSIFPMVMSIGYNPFYKNTVRSAEVHVLHDFKGSDFYDAQMRLMILGFIREEKDYDGLDALIKDINLDCDVARNSLDRVAWRPKDYLRAGKKEPGEGTLDGAWLLRDA